MKQQLKATPARFTEQALAVLRERYLAKDPETGQVIETPDDLIRRVAGCIAESERLFGGAEAAIEEVAAQFARLMAENRFWPNTPTLTNAGRPTAMKQYSACFVIPVPDSMDGIGDAIKAALLIHKSGGGTGFSFSALRPKGDRVRSSGGVASGPVSFMKIIDTATEQVRQGGTRRGANMGILACDHPDILDFIRCKATDGAIRNFNISVAVTDAFMRAVEEDAAWPLVNPRTGQAVRTVRARQVWDELVRHAWRNGEPGLFFIDRANADHPLLHLGRIEATNPCITADVLVYTADGLQRVRDLVHSGQPVDVVLEGLRIYSPATPMFRTARMQPIYRLATEEGYSIRLTKNHKLMTQRGMVPAEELKPGDKLKLLSHGGGFGKDGSRALGLAMGWLIGDGHISNDRACLDFYGEKSELAAMFSDIVNSLVSDGRGGRKSYRVGVLALSRYNKCTVKSMRLAQVLAEYGLTPQTKCAVPSVVFTGTEEMQRGFLQALFSADGTVLGTPNSGVSIRLGSIHLPLLQDIQRVLLNFGIASSIYTNRKGERIGTTVMPDGRGGHARYPTQPWHELVISKSNLWVFAERIGFLLSAKQHKLDRLLALYTKGPYHESFWATFKSLIPDGTEDVYCLTEPITHTFVANGFVIANCGEKPLLPWDACTLGHVNLEAHLVHRDGQAALDEERLRETVRIGVRFLDNVIDAADHPLPQINDMTRRTRQIGLGVMGLARVLFAKGLPYDSDDALEFVGGLMAQIERWAWDASERLAEERGVYPAWTGSRHEAEGRRARNSYVLTIAPTGTTSMIAHTSSGIEPEFSLVWHKRVMDGQLIPYICEPFERVARAEGWWTDELLERIAANHGSCRGLAGVPERWQRVFATAHDIAPAWHVRMQAAVQAHVDSAVSKTINLPASASVQDVAQAYQLAWRLGCKGITVYRDGSRQDQVLNVGAVRSNGAPKPDGNGTQSVSSAATDRDGRRNGLAALPPVLEAKRVRVDTPDGGIYVHIGYVDGQPVEVFTTTPEEAKHEEIYEAFSRIFSIALQHGVPLDRLLKQLDGANRKYGSVATIPAAILRAFRLTQDGRPTDLACPKCQGEVVLAEGCVKCRVCGWSKCE